MSKEKLVLDKYEKYAPVISESLLFRNFGADEIQECIDHAYPKIIGMKKNEFLTMPENLTTIFLVLSGQSMGCMTTLILASEYPDLYAACMFVDGQWDISTLTGLENQTFVYFAAEDDTNAWNGAQEVMSMFDEDSVSYAYAQWDGNWTCDELSAAAQELFTAEENQYFISWATGTIEPVSGGMGASGSFGGPSGSDESGSFAGPGGSGEFSGPGGSDESGSFAGPGGSGEFAGPGGPAGTDSGLAASGMSGMNSSSYHMASFDYAYNCVAVMEWLFAQKS